MSGSVTRPPSSRPRRRRGRSCPRRAARRPCRCRGTRPSRAARLAESISTVPGPATWCAPSGPAGKQTTSPRRSTRSPSGVRAASASPTTTSSHSSIAVMEVVREAPLALAELVQAERRSSPRRSRRPRAADASGSRRAPTSGRTPARGGSPCARAHPRTAPAGASATGRAAGRTRPCACQAAIASTHTAPAAITRPCAATPNAIASSGCIPAATRIAAPAPAWVTAPAGAIGSTAEADDAHRNASASTKFVFKPSAASSTKSASPRRRPRDRDRRPGGDRVARRRRVLLHPAVDAEAREPADPHEPRQREHDARPRPRRRPRRRSAPRGRRRRCR